MYKRPAPLESGNDTALWSADAWSEHHHEWIEWRAKVAEATHRFFVALACLREWQGSKAAKAWVDRARVEGATADEFKQDLWRSIEGRPIS